MYDHQLLKLVQSRHKVLLRVVFVFVILLAFLNLGGTIQGYQNRQEYMLSPSEFTATKSRQQSIMMTRLPTCLIANIKNNKSI